MKALKIVLLIVLLLFLLSFGLYAYLRVTGQTDFLGDVPIPLLPTPTPAPPALEPLPELDLTPETPEEELLARAYAQSWSYTADGPCESDGDRAQQRLTLTVLDADRFAGSGAREELIALLDAQVAQARHLDQVYDEDLRFLPELVRACYRSLLTERLERAGDYTLEQSVVLRYVYTKEGWVLENPEDLYPELPETDSLFAAATEELPFLPLHFYIDEDALCGPVPDESKFTVTDDPAVISALLERPEARALIGEETLVWNPDISLIPGSKLYCYLDESILCIVWQEPTARCVGTFSEIFISDGSQLRRKISSDRPWSLWFEKTSSFAQKANAVLAFGGDFYYHGRECGVSVYQREIVRFRPDNADTCFITADGDMLFLYRGSGVSQEEIQAFLEENDVVFSLAFGPVLIDDGEDVTPTRYPWGEINDYYARSSLGLLGRHHYLTMNINCGSGPYDHLPSLRDAADAMVARGCYKAYTLDGGQTATTVFHYKLINPVQFGWERTTSDIIYFATAVPEES